jgi:hypothetical protein
MKLAAKGPSNDLIVYEDLLSLILEIINSILVHRLKHNSQLVYALLLKKEIFTPFDLHPRLSQVTQNIEQVIYYFNTRVAEANLKAPSTSEVLKLIEQASRTWSSIKLTVSGMVIFSIHQVILISIYSLYQILNFNTRKSKIPMNSLYPMFGH